MTKQIRDIREFQTRIAEEEEGSLFFRPDFKERVAQRMRFLREEVDELEKALNDNDPVEVLDALVDIDYIAKGTAHEAGLLNLLQDGWDLVHANNMTKIGPDGKVLKSDDNKVIKPAGYMPVDLNTLFV